MAKWPRRNEGEKLVSVRKEGVTAKAHGYSEQGDMAHDTFLVGRATALNKGRGKIHGKSNPRVEMVMIAYKKSIARKAWLQLLSTPCWTCLCEFDKFAFQILFPQV